MGQFDFIIFDKWIAKKIISMITWPRKTIKCIRSMLRSPSEVRLLITLSLQCYLIATLELAMLAQIQICIFRQVE